MWSVGAPCRYSEAEAAADQRAAARAAAESRAAVEPRVVSLLLSIYQRLDTRGRGHASLVKVRLASLSPEWHVSRSIGCAPTLAQVLRELERAADSEARGWPTRKRA